MNEKTYHKIRSFVKRERPITEKQQMAFQEFFSLYGLSTELKELDFNQVFGRQAPLVLEIGFGMGEPLVTMAENSPETDFIGIEVYQTGIIELLTRVHEKQLHNVRIFYDDAVEILSKNIPNACLDRVQIFFPDPWPKRKHQKRRLIQENFIKLIHEKLKEGGFFHIKTDWKDYAWSISKTMKTVEGFKAMSESYENLNYPKTKFEKRGMRLAHQVYELIFIKS